MSRRSKRGSFVKTYVIGIGFIGGLFFRAGINPNGTIVEVLSQFLSPDLCALLSILLIIVSFVMLLNAYRLGRFLGIIAIVTAFTGGYLILSPMNAEMIVGIFLAIVAGILGYIAAS